jgi:hypothetical protein
MASSSPPNKQKCAYCGDKFVPVKRGTQRFCGASCRVSYCRKKKAGTLGRITHLPGPPRVFAGLSFPQTVLAAGLGSLGANLLTQAGEYALVTQDLLQQLQAIQHAMAAWGPPPPTDTAALASPPDNAPTTAGVAAPHQAIQRGRTSPVIAPVERALPGPLPEVRPVTAATLAAFDQVLQQPWPVLPELLTVEPA